MLAGDDFRISSGGSMGQCLAYTATARGKTRRSARSTVEDPVRGDSMYHQLGGPSLHSISTPVNQVVNNFVQ